VLFRSELLVHSDLLAPCSFRNVVAGLTFGRGAKTGIATKGAQQFSEFHFVLPLLNSHFATFKSTRHPRKQRFSGAGETVCYGYVAESF